VETDEEEPADGAEPDRGEDVAAGMDPAAVGDAVVTELATAGSSSPTPQPPLVSRTAATTQAHRRLRNVST
jgi:hypothetical protein